MTLQKRHVLVVDTTALITAERVLEALGNDCLLRLVARLYREGRLVVTDIVYREFCGGCRTRDCLDLCGIIEAGGVYRGYDRGRLELLVAVEGLDPGEASAVAAAESLALRGRSVTIVTADRVAREFIENMGLGVDVHGDLYLFEAAKLRGICGPEEAAGLVESLPALGRRVTESLARSMAEALRSQSTEARGTSI